MNNQKIIDIIFHWYNQNKLLPNSNIKKEDIRIQNFTTFRTENSIDWNAIIKINAETEYIMEVISKNNNVTFKLFVYQDMFYKKDN